MKRIYLSKKLEYRHGYTLNAHIPYQAEFDNDRQLWLIHMGETAPFLPVLSKFVERIEEQQPILT